MCLVYEGNKFERLSVWAVAKSKFDTIGFERLPMERVEIIKDTGEKIRNMMGAYDGGYGKRVAKKK